MCGQRGLLADSDDQTFGMALSQQFRTHYDTITAPIQAEVHQLHKLCLDREYSGRGRKEGMRKGVKEGGRERVKMEIGRYSVEERGTLEGGGG